MNDLFNTCKEMPFECGVIVGFFGFILLLGLFYFMFEFPHREKHCYKESLASIEEKSKICDNYKKCCTFLSSTCATCMYLKDKELYKEKMDFLYPDYSDEE